MVTLAVPLDSVDSDGMMYKEDAGKKAVSRNQQMRNEELTYKTKEHLGQDITSRRIGAGGRGNECPLRWDWQDLP
jgi:hypothetical protein